MLTPSRYQQAILDWISTGCGNGFVNAVAGSGKSTQLEMGVQRISSKERILILAFNTHIKVAMTERMRRFPAVTVETFNSLGWKILRKCHGRLELRPNKTDMLLKAYIRNDGMFQLYKTPMRKMVSILRAVNDVYASADRMLEIASFYSIDLDVVGDKRPFLEALGYVLGASVNSLAPCDFDDQVFQPIFQDLPIPEFDWIMVDESQDSSPINIEMVCRLQQAAFGRVITVGDPDQAIYLFRGAHPKAMREYVTRLDAKELPLNECFRCPNSVIELAKQYVPRIEAPVPNPKGEGKVELLVSTPTFVKEVKAGHIVLCRCVAPLVKRCLQQIRLGNRAYVKGRSLTDQLIALIEDLYGSADILKRQYNDKTRYNRSPDIDDLEWFCDKLSGYRLERVSALERLGREMEAADLDDRCETINVLANDATHVVDIIIKLETIFSDDDDYESICFMTGHKAKGLEADNVWILRPDLCPHPRAKTKDAIEQESHLMYVMITRCMKHLRTVRKERGEK